jgi:hypothetical protein
MRCGIGQWPVSVFEGGDLVGYIRENKNSDKKVL